MKMKELLPLKVYSFILHINFTLILQVTGARPGSAIGRAPDS